MKDMQKPRENAFVGRVFSIMRRRDDLPEMTLPLALLFLCCVALFASAAAKLASPVVIPGEGLFFEPQNLIGVVASLPFLPLSACLYALLILLWRRFAALLATPMMFILMLACGADLFASVVISTSLLFVSYVFAVSLISRENRFRRLTSLAFSIAVCLILTIIAWIGMYFDSIPSFTQAYMTEISSLIGQLYSAYVGSTTVGLASEVSMLPQFYLEKMARDLFVMCPAYLGILSIVLAWLTDFLSATAFRLLDCEDVFIEITHRITMPFSYAVVYAGVFMLSLLTSAEYNPMLYVMLRSVLDVMLLPCAAVGIAGILRILEDKFYYLTREKLLAALVMFFALFMMGISVFLLLTSAVGAASVIIAGLKKKPDNTIGERE